MTSLHLYPPRRTTYWNIFILLRGNMTRCLLSFNNNSAIWTPYTTLLTLEFVLPRGSWFISPSKKYNLSWSSHVIMWPFSCSRKTSRCFVVINLVVSSDPSTLGTLDIMDLKPFNLFGVWLHFKSIFNALASMTLTGWKHLIESLVLEPRTL